MHAPMVGLPIFLDMVKLKQVLKQLTFKTTFLWQLVK